MKNLIFFERFSNCRWHSLFATKKSAPFSAKVVQSVYWLCFRKLLFEPFAFHVIILQIYDFLLINATFPLVFL